MAHQMIDLKCPGCGAPVNMGMAACPYCGRPVVISTFRSVYEMPLHELNQYAGAYKRALSEDPENGELNRSAAMCYLKLRQYEKALSAFEKAVETDFDNSETYFYAAICLLKGKRPFLAVKPVIDRIEEYINSALMIEPKGIYYYFLSYIKYDYYYLKKLKTNPDFEEVLDYALESGLSVYDVEQLYAVLGTEKPDCL